MPITKTQKAYVVDLAAHRRKMIDLVKSAIVKNFWVCMPNGKRGPWEKVHTVNAIVCRELGRKPTFLNVLVDNAFSELGIEKASGGACKGLILKV
jgi:hypothetical protein